MVHKSKVLTGIAGYVDDYFEMVQMNFDDLSV